MLLVVGLFLTVAPGLGGFGGATLPTAVMQAEPVSTCAEARAAVLAAASPEALEADVDGDGATDRVFVATRPDAPPRCRYFLVAQTGATAVVRPVRFAERDASFAAEIRIPQVLVLAEVDRRPGAEAVVVVWRGASTEFAALFAVRDGRFVRLRVPGTDGLSRHTFAFAGSVGNAFAVDCRGRASGVVRTVSASYAPPRYRSYVVETTLYRLRGTAFRVVSQRERRMSLDALETHPAFRGPGQPFPSCTVAGGIETG